MKYTYRQRQGNAKKMQFRQTQEALKKPIQREREREKKEIQKAGMKQRYRQKALNMRRWKI